MAFTPLLTLVIALWLAVATGLKVAFPSTEGHYWMGKNGNALRTGQSGTLQGPQNLSKASWVFQAPIGASFYQSPVIDRDGNAYVSSMGPNIMYSFTRSGQMRWAKPLSTRPLSLQTTTPVLIGDALYTT